MLKHRSADTGITSGLLFDGPLHRYNNFRTCLGVPIRDTERGANGGQPKSAFLRYKQHRLAVRRPAVFDRRSARTGARQQAVARRTEQFQLLQRATFSVYTCQRMPRRYAARSSYRPLGLKKRITRSQLQRSALGCVRSPHNRPRFYGKSRHGFVEGVPNSSTRLRFALESSVLKGSPDAPVSTFSGQGHHRPVSGRLCDTRGRCAQIRCSSSHFRIVHGLSILASICFPLGVLKLSYGRHSLPGYITLAMDRKGGVQFSQM